MAHEARSFVQFRIDGRPIGKGRVRFARTKHGGVRTYTPKATLVQEVYISKLAMVGMVGKNPTDKPVEVVIRVVFAPPNKISKARREKLLDGETVPIIKPDLDNIMKTILDACNHVVWQDDSQVYAVLIDKVYGTVPGVDVTVYEREVGIWSRLRTLLENFMYPTRPSGD